MPPKISDRLSALKQKQEALARQVSALQQKEKAEARKLETRRKIIVGGLVLAYMEKDPSFADKIRELVSTNIARPHDVAAVADLLPPAMVEALMAAREKSGKADNDQQSPEQEFREAAAG